MGRIIELNISGTKRYKRPNLTANFFFILYSFNEEQIEECLQKTSNLQEHLLTLRVPVSLSLYPQEVLRTLGFVKTWSLTNR